MRHLPPVHLHAEVVALVVALVVAYEWAVRRLGPTRVGPGETAVTARQRWAYWSGVAATAVAAEWPVHDIAERYLFSVHMFQHLLLSLVAPGLMLLGTPAWLLRLILRPRWLRAVVGQLTRPFYALVLFNAVIVVTHWPAWVALTVRSEPFHFVAHALLFGAALCMWWPVVSPLPEMPTLSYPARMIYLFLQSIVPTVPASFLTFGSEPLYRVYATFPRLWNLDVLTDQRIAGLTMKLAGGAILWVVMAVIFFRWFGQEQKTPGWDAVEWHRAERDIRVAMNPRHEVPRP
ncbi:MAG: cytochrome c oxidase assembly protein [Actinomycetota bacterium]